MTFFISFFAASIFLTISESAFKALICLSAIDFSYLIVCVLEISRSVCSYDKAFISGKMPMRSENSHKGDFGRILNIAGSIERQNEYL